MAMRMAYTAAMGATGPATPQDVVSGVAGAPRFPLSQIPTPLQRTGRLAQRLGCPPLYVKRDDLTGLALGGNKVRKLEYLLGHALDDGCDMIITGGGPGSNHCMTTAAAAQVAGLDCLLVLYGTVPATEPGTLTLARQAGAEIRFTGESDRSSVDRYLEPVADEQRSRGRRPYVIPRGGATPVGSLGYVQALMELADQVSAGGLHPGALLVATGSCGTQAGLLAGAIAADRHWPIVGASVSRPVAECQQRVRALARACTERLGVRPPRPEDVVVLDARGPGYGRPSPEGERCARLAAETDGLLLDPVYTAKALAKVPTVTTLEGDIVFWHTGGTAAAVAASADRARMWAS